MDYYFEKGMKVRSVCVHGKSKSDVLCTFKLA